MKKILLMCNAGMSTSMLVQKMKAAANEMGMDADISASSISAPTDEMMSADVILLGPQVSYQKNELLKRVDGKVPVDVIDMRDYGMMNGKKVLEKALSMMKED